MLENINPYYLVFCQCCGAEEPEWISFTAQIEHVCIKCSHEQNVEEELKYPATTS